VRTRVAAPLPCCPNGARCAAYLPARRGTLHPNYPLLRQAHCLGQAGFDGIEVFMNFKHRSVHIGVSHTTDRCFSSAWSLATGGHTRLGCAPCVIARAERGSPIGRREVACLRGCALLRSVVRWQNANVVLPALIPHLEPPALFQRPCRAHSTDTTASRPTERPASPCGPG
jgi:hypothetical protein